MATFKQDLPPWNELKYWAVPLFIFVAVLVYHVPSRPSIHQHGQRLRCPPDTLPILGNAIRFLQPRHVLFAWFVRCQRQFGLDTLSITVPSLPAGVLISDPKNLEFVLKNESSITKGEFFRRRSWDLFGYGIINATGELWKAQRKAGLKFFSGANLDLLIEEVMPEVYHLMKDDLTQHAKEHTQVDMQKVFLDLTTRVMGLMAYEMEVDSSHPFSQAFDYASDCISRRFQNPLYFLTELFTGSKLRSALVEVKRFGKQIFNNARKNRSKAAFESLMTNEEIHSDTLIDSLMTTFEHPDIVADAALNFLSAGRDTTAQSFTWTLYLLMKHADKTTSFLQPELINISINNHPSLTVADLQTTIIPRITAVFYESLRLYPPVPFELKQCQTDITLPDGTFLPNGSIVIWCIWSMNRAHEVFGNDADSFNPARWLDCDGKLIARTAFEFPVFNGGPRACLGKKMAEVMAGYLITRLLKDFTFEELVELDGVGKAKERVSQNSLTLPMKDGLPCFVKLRKKT